MLRLLSKKEKEIQSLSEEKRWLFEERAAILEFDAGMTREAAEALALEYLTPKQKELFQPGNYLT
jgi:hypothetical protein